MKNYVLLDYDCDGFNDAVGVISAIDDAEFDSKVVLACSKYYSKSAVIIGKYGKVGDGTIRLDIKCEDDKYLTYLNAEETEVY